MTAYRFVWPTREAKILGGDSGSSGMSYIDTFLSSALISRTSLELSTSLQKMASCVLEG